MNNSPMILNERDAREAKQNLVLAEIALSARENIALAAKGFPSWLIASHQKVVASYKDRTATSLQTYNSLKSGDLSTISLSKMDPGVSLIVARIAKGLSQKQLAERLGLKEQQIQRYESERYRSISLSNFRRVASLLDVNITATVQHAHNPFFLSFNDENSSIDKKTLDKIVHHAEAENWFEVKDKEATSHQVLRYISSARDNYGSPALLRTGINSKELADDISLLAWRARTLDLAKTVLDSRLPKFNLINLDWLRHLVGISRLEHGPALASEALKENGIILVIEPQISGLALDGAAFVVNDTPVIALTLRHDRIDNFWFTLMHELGHVYLHYYSGLSLGFFDNLDFDDIDQMEIEANNFASTLLIPDESWKISPARISKIAGPAETFAQQLGIHPAIVFGRMRKERNNYKIFSDRVGAGQVRKCFNLQKG
ncbi:XRE family transcriptional regulator [Phyllobacterium sp. CCNWLW109]|uniref:XRE family transcriptional regulator n=1 Tax=Phyllobacterium sp. CCNWLW109 TaxID=3127479 RepID=UPI003076E0C3